MSSSCPVNLKVCQPTTSAESHLARSQSHGRPGRPSRLEAESDADRTAAAATAAATGSAATAAVPQTTRTQSTSLDHSFIWVFSHVLAEFIYCPR